MSYRDAGEKAEHNKITPAFSWLSLEGFDPSSYSDQEQKRIEQKKIPL
jgi:hypothetical protein